MPGTRTYDGDIYAAVPAHRYPYPKTFDGYAQKPRRRKLTRAQRLARWIVRNYILVVLITGIILGTACTVVCARFYEKHHMRDYGRELKYTEYVVKPGDSLWDISVDMAALNPEFPDVRSYLSLLKEVNYNYGDNLPAGSTIRIPYYDGGRNMMLMDIYAKYGLYK